MRVISNDIWRIYPTLVVINLILKCIHDEIIVRVDYTKLHKSDNIIGIIINDQILLLNTTK